MAIFFIIYLFKPKKEGRGREGRGRGSKLLAEILLLAEGDLGITVLQGKMLKLS